MSRLHAIAYGPGLAATGTRIEVEATPEGVSFRDPLGGECLQRWESVDVRRSGWDGSQLRLEWRSAAGLRTLVFLGTEDVATISRLAGGRVSKGRTDRTARVLVHAVLWFGLVLPLLAVVLLVWQHDRITGWAVSVISLEQERKLGEMVFEQHRARLRLVEGPAQDMVRDIGARLTRGSRYAYSFHVAHEPSVNAFAVPGGFIVVHTGLLALADSPEEVAAVLAHEVAHIERRHSLKAMAKSLGLAATVSMVFGDFGGLATLGADLLNLRFSREHELDADREGLRILVAAGIRPDGMRTFFSKMAEKPALSPSLLSTHPAAPERLQAIEKLIDALPAGSREAAPLPHDHRAVKASLPR